MKIITSATQCLTVVFICVISFVNVASAQKGPVKWGKISKNEWDMEYCSFDSTAGAVMLSDFGKIVFQSERSGLEGILLRHTRIKIFNENGYDEGGVEIPFYSYDKMERVYHIKAHAIHEDGRVIKLNKKDIYTEELNEYWSVVKFAIPDIQPGTIIEYSYTKSTGRLTTLFTWNFQRNIPVMHSELYVEVPGYLEYFYLIQGESNFSKFDRKTGAAEGYGTQNITTNISHMILNNAPAIKEEAHVTTIENFRTKIRFQLATYLERNGNKQDILGSWEILHNTLMSHENMGTALKRDRKSRNFLEIGLSTITEDMTPKEKMNTLYQFVTSHIKWNEYSGILLERDIDDIFEEGSTSSGSLNLCLLKLLQAAGLEAYPVLTSSREHGRLIPQYAILDQFNHTMVLCKINDEDYFLDAIDELIPVGLPATRHLNELGWLILPESFEWIKIPATPSTDMFQLIGKIEDDGDLKVTYRSRYTNYNAIPERRNAIKLGDVGETWKLKLRDKFSKITFENIEMQKLNEASHPFSESFELNIQNFAETSGQNILVNPLIFTAYDENPFKSENRHYPIEFSYPIGELFNATYKIPDNWEVESLPDPITAILGDKVKYTYNVNVQSGNLILIHKLDVNTTYFPAEDYAYLKEIFDLVAKSARNQIVFKKKMN